jgi:hypothetical protein
MERGSKGLDRPGLVRAISWKHVQDLRVKPCLQAGGRLAGFVLHYGKACDCRGLQSRNALRLSKYACDFLFCCIERDPESVSPRCIKSFSTIALPSRHQFDRLTVDAHIETTCFEPIKLVISESFVH